jgi:hypothetical protein
MTVILLLKQPHLSMQEVEQDFMEFDRFRPTKAAALNVTVTETANQAEKSDKRDNEKNYSRSDYRKLYAQVDFVFYEGYCGWCGHYGHAKPTCITFKIGRDQASESLKKKRKLSATQRSEKKTQIQDRISSKKTKESANAVDDEIIIAVESSGGSMVASANCVQVFERVFNKF